MIEDRIIELTARKLANEATPAELEELNNYLLYHPEATYYTELLSQLWDGQPTTFTTDVPAAYLKHIARHQPDFDAGDAGLDESYQLPRPTTRRYRLLAAASILLFIVAASIYLIPFRGKKTTGDQKNTELIAANGERKKIILPDGTQIWLNSGSRLSYDSIKYNKDTRVVSLSGEAFFDVTKNKDKPFIIYTKKISIKVLGTAFNVKAYPGEKLTEATLLRGAIEFTDNNKPYQKIMLKPNEKVVLIEDNPGKTRVSKSIDQAKQQSPDPDINKNKLVIQEIQPVLIADKSYIEEVSWVENELVFQNESFEELIPKMERWFNVVIDINNESLKQKHFSGVFHKESINEALYAMQIICAFKYKINQNHVLIN
jgi:ferric-dicitrate binding protein FerR (iron transport regulator)